MLKINTQQFDNEVLIILEGSLTGPWVAELETAWRRANTERRPGKTRVDLSGVTFVSEAGTRLLDQICAAGAEIVSADLCTKALADELSRKHRRTENR